MAALAHTDLPAATPAQRVRATFADALRRLFRPVRVTATPAFTLFPDWATWTCAWLIGAGVTLAGMAYVDPVVMTWQREVTGFAALVFEILTDIGKSGWFLIPTGVLTLAILIRAPLTKDFSERVVLALCARAAFLFLAVGGSGLIITIVKRLIGRARPWAFDAMGTLYFNPTAWSAQFASFPSGHSQTAFAIAVALLCLFPRWRSWLLGVAVIVAASRVIVDAHYFTDIVVGSMWGAWFTWMTREWFARRGLVFSPSASRAPFPMPQSRVRAAVKRLIDRPFP
jgi:undecaprenyl-diphosphatase